MAETLATSPLPTPHQNPEPDQPPADHNPPPPPTPQLRPHGTATTDSGSPTKAAPLEPPSPPPRQLATNPVGPSSVPAAGSEKGREREPERQTFSQLLAGAMASGSSSKMTGLPRLTVPCFVSPQGFLDSSPFTGQFAMSHQAALASVTAQAQMQLRTGNLSSSPSPTLESIPPQTTVSLEAKPTESEEKVITPAPESLHVSECEQKSQSNHDLVRITSGDGYNWRKYGQKQVKASVNSRSYYRCTHSNCTAKKKVEHCQDGSVYDITYQGDHSHEPPQKVKSPKERLFQRPQISGSLKDEQNLDISSREPNHCSPKNDQDSRKEKSEQLHCSSDCEVDPNTYTEGDGEQPDPKRRLCEVPVAYIPSLFKTARDAKIVVQSSCVEGPANDGYRWRKYGQKNVKGSSSPRSYYKCTHTGCPVRKHVERAEDAKTFITTYERHHNHDIPPKKSGSGSGSDAPASATSDEQKQASNSVERTPSESKTINSVAAESQVKPFESARSLSGIRLESSGSKDTNGGNGSDIVQRPLFDKSRAVVPVKNS